MSFEGLHETVIRDIVDAVRDGIDGVDSIGFAIKGTSSGRLASSTSLSKATEGLVLVFPHLCTESTSVETAAMLTKAIETKAVSLLQIAFSAFNITNSQDAVSFVRQFHTNIGSGKMTLDKFMDAMDSATNESGDPFNGVDRRLVRSVLEEFKQMECYFEEDLTESSINDFSVINRYGNYVITEARNNNKKNNNNKPKLKGYGGGYTPQLHQFRHRVASEKRRDEYQRERDAKQDEYRRERDAAQDKYRKERDDAQDTYRQKRDFAQDVKDYRNYRQKEREIDLKAADIDNKQFKDDFDMIKQQLMPTDVKKANDMVPTMMIINFVTTRGDNNATPIRSQAVIGIKAKLYPVTSSDIINKIIVKNADTNVFLKLMRVSTRELNFVKDFLLAIDDAKLSAISCSTKGSDTNKLLKLLERRALKGKIRSKLNMKNAYKAITTLTISKEEADMIKQYNNVDVYNPSTIRKIMETLNIMQFIIVDDSEECAYIIMDTGEDMYEKISYTHLERESADGSYKKAINLMTQVMR